MYTLAKGVSGLQNDNVKLGIPQGLKPRNRSGGYTDYIPNDAAVTIPLTDLTKKGHPQSIKSEAPNEHIFKNSS